MCWLELLASVCHVEAVGWTVQPELDHHTMSPDVCYDVRCIYCMYILCYICNRNKIKSFTFHEHLTWSLLMVSGPWYDYWTVYKITFLHGFILLYFAYHTTVTMYVLHVSNLSHRMTAYYGTVAVCTAASCLYLASCYGDVQLEYRPFWVLWWLRNSTVWAVLSNLRHSSSSQHIQSRRILYSDFTYWHTGWSIWVCMTSSRISNHAQALRCVWYDIPSEDGW